MNGDSIALDTNAAIGVVKAEQSVCDAIADFDAICLPIPVVGELRFGALNSKKSQENLERIEKLVSSCVVLNTTDSTAIFYAELRIDLKRNGTPIPENDLWIAAICVERGIPLAADDVHFDNVKSLHVVKV